jgi:hypothetical protein
VILSGFDCTNHARQKALLLHLADEAVFDIFPGLVIDPVSADADEAVVNVNTITKKALDNHFNPKRNVEFERYTFRSVTQNASETMHIKRGCVR